MYSQPGFYRKNSVETKHSTSYSEEEPILKQFSVPHISIPKAEQKELLWNRESIVSLEFKSRVPPHE